MDWVVSETGAPLDTLEILGITAHGYHGVLTAERAVGQPFVVDVHVHLDTRPSAEADRLDLSVDYSVIAQQVVDIISGEPVFLIETLAGRIADSVLRDPRIHAAEIAVHKPSAPMQVHASDVIVRIRRAAEFARPTAEGEPEPVEETSDEESPDPDSYPRRPPAPRPRPGEEFYIPSAPMLPEVAAFGEPGVAIAGQAGVPAPQPEAAPPQPEATPQLPAPAAQAAPTPGPAPTPAPTPASAPAPEEKLPLDPVALLAKRGLPLTRRNLADAEAELARRAEAGPEAELPAEAEPADAPPPTDPTAQAPTASLDTPPRWPADAILGLGANLGDALGTLRGAIESLRSVPGIDVIGVSPLARTKPVGFDDQPDFFNAVIAIRTTLSPRALLYTTQGIEEQYGRDRSKPGGPRTLDIDIIAFDTLLDGDDELEIPHPRAHERAFVLLPWATLAPDAFLPGLGGGSVSLLADRAPDRGGVHWLALDWLTLPVSLTGALPKPPPASPNLSWAV